MGRALLVRSSFLPFLPSFLLLPLNVAARARLRRGPFCCISNIPPRPRSQCSAHPIYHFTFQILSPLSFDVLSAFDWVVSLRCIMVYGRGGTLNLPKTSMNVCFDKEGPARAAGTLCIGGYPCPLWGAVFRIITHGQLIALSIYVENITEQTHPLTRQERSALSLTPDLSLLVSLLLSVPSYFPLPSPIHLTRPRSQFFGSTLIAFLQRKKNKK